MKTVRMSRTGLEVSELCFGTLTLGRLQANLSPQAGGDVIRRALESGVTFFDTARGLWKLSPSERRFGRCKQWPSATRQRQTEKAGFSPQNR